MQSQASTVQKYLAEQSAERRSVLQAVRQVILKHLDHQYEEGMQYGMISYYVPHRVYPAGYHCDPRQPLPFLALAAQKNYFSLYAMSLYLGAEAEARFRAQWEATGKKLNMGKSCIRFQSASDLALDLIGELVRQMPAKAYIKLYESRLRDAPRKSPPAAGAKTSRGRAAKRDRPAATAPSKAPRARPSKAPRAGTKKPAAAKKAVTPAARTAKRARRK